MNAILEDTREPKYIHKKPEPIALCECCEKDLYAGDWAMKNNNFKTVNVYLCGECFIQVGKKELAEILGATFEKLC